VILRGGLTPTLHWAHAFLCAISCPGAAGGMDRGSYAMNGLLNHLIGQRHGLD
jgi:hypothetical protein